MARLTKFAILSLIAVPMFSFAQVHEKTQAVDAQSEGVIPWLSASSAGKPWPVGPPRSLEHAYQIQTNWVKKQLKGRQPLGFKAGLTSKAAQASFGANQAVAGVLLPHSKVTGRIDLIAFSRPKLEVEYGFVMGCRLSELPSDQRLKECIAGVAPVIELPDINFAGRPSVADIVAGNVAASRWLAGDMTAWAGEATQFSLYKNAQLQSSALVSYPIKGLKWLVQRVLANGWVIQPGQMLMTGAVLPIIDLDRADWRVQTSDLGSLNLITR